MSSAVSVHYQDTFNAIVGRDYLVLQIAYTQGGDTFGSFTGAVIDSQNSIEQEISSSTKARICLITANSATITPFYNAATYQQYSYSHFILY